MKTLKVALFLQLAASCGWAQTQNQGAIVGTVTDPSGAVIPGANVTISNMATAIATSSTTDTRGDYRFPFVTPGLYTVSVEAQGFSKTSIQSVTVAVGTTTRTDIKMEVCAANQEVTVTESAPLLNTENAERGDVLVSEQIQHLPLNGREFLQLAALEPGAVNGNPKRGVHASKGGVDISFNGARGTTNSFYINGASSNDPLYNTLASSPALDAVAEFRVLTNMYSAQYGRSGGAVISVLTKSGNNGFHGTAYEYHRNKVLDALPYFYTGNRKDLANYLFNQWGGTFGGPIIKKKTFFFFSGEAYHQVKPGQLIVSFAPTEAERNGDVSKTINPFSGMPVVLTNPNTQEPIPGNVLPASMINSTGKFLMSLWPKPNYSGDPFLNLREFRGGVYTQKKFLTRVDHRFSAKDTITGTWDYNNYDNVGAGFNIYADKTQVDHTKTWAGTWTHTFNSNLVTDTKFSFSSLQSGSQFTLT